MQTTTACEARRRGARTFPVCGGHDDEKKRPALVLTETVRSPSNRLVTVAMITSQIEALRLEGDVLLEQWKAAGLLHPSLLRRAKVATVKVGLVDKVIGQLGKLDHEAARQAFHRVFTS